MDWRSSSRSEPRSQPVICLGGLAGLVGLVGVVAALALGAAGCGMNAVRASEKEFLADRVMVFDGNGQEAGADDHIQANREGAAGDRGTAGGGCACN